MSDTKESMSKKLWRFSGSYGVGIVLMLILLVLTFAGTMHQVRLAPTLGVDAAIESFLGEWWVFIPLTSTTSELPMYLPLPGLPVVCILLFINLLIGGVIQVNYTWRRIGVLVAHVGILLLLGSVMLGGYVTKELHQIELPEGEKVVLPEIPFSLTLNKFVAEYYPGTQKPKNYESHLILEQAGDKQEVVIRMNEPLRRDGWTLYQMSFGQDVKDASRSVSVLKASHNPLEQCPKWASYIIALGLLWHFGGIFVSFLKNSSNKDEPQPESSVIEKSTPRYSKLKLWGIIGGVLLVFGIGLMAAKPMGQPVFIEKYSAWSQELVDEIGAMAVLDGGRVKPVSTYAGFQMLRVLGKRSFSIDTSNGKKKIKPVEWMLDCIFRPELAAKYPIFLVNREEVVHRLGLPDLPDKRKKYSFEQLRKFESNIAKTVYQLQFVPTENLTDADKEVLALYGNMKLVSSWMMMPEWMVEGNAEMLNRGLCPKWFYVNGEWCAMPAKNVATVLAMLSVVGRKSFSEQLVSLSTPEAMGLFRTYLITPNYIASENERETLEYEVLYYHIEPLYLSLILFIAAFVCLLLCILVKAKYGASTWVARLLRPQGMSLPWFIGTLGAVILIVGLVLRCFITMRSPVGNTYETIAFIACSGMICALVVEICNKRGIVLMTGLILGGMACQMGIMYESSQAIDHMDPLVAILRSNFLLFTHVITIVLGYAAGLLATVLSHVYLLAKPLRLLDKPTQRSLDKIAYGVLCFSLLFTLIGTIFGGIWGNESWGRFWGWDPKENGALMIVLWQLIVLHARLAGWLNSWLLHFSNVICGVIIAFAWWGVNMLGVGLHSYEFTSGQNALNFFYAAEVFVIILFLVLKCRELRREKLGM